MAPWWPLTQLIGSMIAKAARGVPIHRSNVRDGGEIGNDLS